MVVLSDKEKTIGKGFIADLFYSGGVITNKEDYDMIIKKKNKREF